jgi:hypothetical protein
MKGTAAWLSRGRRPAGNAVLGGGMPCCALLLHMASGALVGQAGTGHRAGGAVGWPHCKPLPASASRALRKGATAGAVAAAVQPQVACGCP